MADFSSYYDIGAASTDTGSPNDRTKIYGIGTRWGDGVLGPVLPGDTFIQGGLLAKVLSVQGDEELTLTKPWPGEYFVEAAYEIVQDSPLRNTKAYQNAALAAHLERIKIFDSAAPVYPVKDFDLTEPPADAVKGDLFVVSSTPQAGNVFSAHPNELAEKTETGWLFTIPEAGWVVVDMSVVPQHSYIWDALNQEWNAAGGLLGAPVWYGQWNALTTYPAGAVVSYLNKIWAADEETTGDTPDGSPTKWSVFLTIGEHGGAILFEYRFKSATAAATADVEGQLAFNMTVPHNAATKLYLSNKDLYGNDWTNILDTLADSGSTRKGRFRVIAKGDPTKQVVGTVTGVVGVNSPSSRYELDLGNPTPGSSPLEDGDEVLFIWNDVGDKGDEGNKGDTGDRGMIGGPSVRLIFSPTTGDADPGVGKVRLDQATQSAAGFLRVSTQSADASDITGLLDVIPIVGLGTTKAVGWLAHRDTPETKWMFFTVEDVLSPSVNYRNIDISNVKASSPNPFTDGDELTLTLIPLEQGPEGEKGDTGDTGDSFYPQYVVPTISGREAYDFGPVFDANNKRLSVLVERDENHDNKPYLYFLLTAAQISPTEGAVWSEGVPFAPTASADGIEYDPTDAGVTLESNTVQKAIDLAILLANQLQGAWNEIASDTTTAIFGTDDEKVKWQVTGAAPGITNLGTGVNQVRIAWWRAGSRIVAGAAITLVNGDTERVNDVDSFSLFVSDANGVAREVHYSAGYQGALNLNSIEGMRVSADANGDMINDFRISEGIVRSDDDSVDLILPSAKVKRLDAVWAPGTGVGGAVKSANQTGTVLSSGTAVTGSLTAFLAVFGTNDLITSLVDGLNNDITAQISGLDFAGPLEGYTTKRRPLISVGGVTTPVNSVGSNTSLTTAANLGASAGSSFQRGGPAMGSEPIYYAVGVCRKDSDGSVEAFASSFTGSGEPDLPTGYTKKRTLAVVKWDGVNPLTVVQPLKYKAAPQAQEIGFENDDVPAGDGNQLDLYEVLEWLQDNKADLDSPTLVTPTLTGPTMTNPVVSSGPSPCKVGRYNSQSRKPLLQMQTRWMIMRRGHSRQHSRRRPPRLA